MEFSKSARPIAFRPPRRVSSAPVASQPSTGGNAAPSSLVETLYVHPNVKIVSFTAPVKPLPPGVDTSREEAGTLPPSSRLERTIAVGSLRIYRAPGSVAFVNCGPALQPILPKSQCWCIDETDAKFVLQIRRPNFWRIELSTSDEEDTQRGGRALREVLGMILQFEKTYCPFQRSFSVDLPEDLSIPVKKRPWTPKRLPTRQRSLDVDASRALEAPELECGRHDTINSGEESISTTSDLSDINKPIVSPEVPAKGDGNVSELAIYKPNSPSETTGMPPDYGLVDPFSQDAGMSSGLSAEAGTSTAPTHLASPESAGSVIVAPIVNEIQCRIAHHAVSQPDESASFPSTPDAEPKISHSEQQQSSLVKDERVLGIVSEKEARHITQPQPTEPSGLGPAQPTASLIEVASSSTGDASRTTVISAPTSHSRTPSQDSFHSIESWHSLTVRLPPSPPMSQIGGGPAEYPVHDGNDVATPKRGRCSIWRSRGRAASVGSLQESLETNDEGSAATTPKATSSSVRRRGSTRKLSITQRSPSPLPPSDVLAPSSDADLSSYRAVSSNKITGPPSNIITKTYGILLAPPAHLIALMVKVAAKITAGEWRGEVYGYSNNGEQIPVQWDYYSDGDLSD